MFSAYYLFREMASLTMPHPVAASGGGMPCPGKVIVGHIDMRFEDNPATKNMGQFTPFWVQIPGNENVFLVFHGDKGGPAELLNHDQAAPYMASYQAVPHDWWKYAAAMDKDLNNYVKFPAKPRSDYENYLKVDASKICGTH